MITITIDEKKLEIPAEMTILNAARQAGITIPTLCDHKDLSPYGVCRLCIVEVEGARSPRVACKQTVSDGMVVRTDTPELTESRIQILNKLLSAYYDAGYAENDQGDNELIRWAKHYGIDVKASQTTEPAYAVNSDPNPFVWVDMNKCILCCRCVRACAEIQGRFVWKRVHSENKHKIVAGTDQPMLEARCESCGACVAYCPTAALDDKMSIGLGKPDRVVSTVCTYCGVGCILNLNVKDNKIIRVTSNPDAPVNGMHLCVKGRYGYDFVHHPDRLTKPMVRDYLLEGGARMTKADRGRWVEVDWSTALDVTAKKLAATLDAHGPNSVGILTSAKCTNEENYLMNKLARQVIGTNSIDHCARL